MEIQASIQNQTAHRVLLVEDHPLFVRALQDLLREHYPGHQVFAASSCAEAVSWLAEFGADHSLCAIFCDLELPDAQAAQAVQRLRPMADCPLWVISAESSSSVVEQALAHGANGFISKRADAHSILAGLKRALGSPQAPSGKSLNGDEWILSASQQRVARQLVLGLSNKEIARVLYLGLETVKSHVSEIIGRLDVRNRTEAVRKLLKGQTQ